MNTNEVKEENVKTIVKLGIDVEDIADIYLKVATKGHDISKQKFIEQLTEIFKFFQSRNKGLEETQEVIYKDDVLNMIMKNRNMINLNVNKKIKAICEKLDSYYFMTQEETNKLIKANPKKIIYISCDVATQARDIKYLQEHNYFVDLCQPVDMFPHTTHIENIVRLNRV